MGNNANHSVGVHDQLAKNGKSVPIAREKGSRYRMDLFEPSGLL